MSYPGDSALDARIQQRILSAFAEAVRLYQEGSPEECRTVLRSILEVDPSFTPASRLMTSVDDGVPVDLGQLLGDVGASGIDTEAVVIEARQTFAERKFARAIELAREVLHELPGHEEAKKILLEAEGRVRAAPEVERYVQRARTALKDGSLREVEALLELARNLDPSHPDLVGLEREIEESPASGVGERTIEFDFGDVVREIEEEDTVKATVPAAAAKPPAKPPATTSAPGSAVPSPGPEPTVEAVASGAGPAQAPSVPPAGASYFEFAEEPPARERPPGFPVDGDAQAGAPRFGSGEQFGLAEAEEADDAAERVESLLAQGQDAYDKGEFQGAIDAWSRIYLIQAENPEADRRLVEARERLEEVQRQADHRFYEAREAFEQGRTEEARALCQEVLKLEPRHLEAQDLIARLDTPAAPPPPSTAPVEEDLFHDDFVPTSASLSSGEGAAVGGASTVREALTHRLRQGPEGKRLPLPLPALVLGGGLVVVLLVLGFVLRSSFFDGGGTATETTIAQAQEAADQGRLQEAIDLLNSLRASEQLDGDVANQVSQRIVSYQRRLKATASPVPRVDSTPIRAALENGKRVKALRLVESGLAKVPGDTELTRFKSEILSYSPLIATLAEAADERDNETVRRAAQELQREHPGDSEASRLWRAATFNEAIMLLRKYQVGSAKGLLDQLANGDADPEVERVRTFASRYISKPVDPRYQIFVTNVELRPLE
jgi:tetratricopeptide (TPR) repeat protein